MSILRHSRYVPARGGPAPGDIRDAFLEGLELLLAQEEGEPEPRVEVRGRTVPVSAVFGLLWNCSDILPTGARSTLADLGVELSGRWTYAAAARQLRPYVVRV